MKTRLLFGALFVLALGCFGPAVQATSAQTTESAKPSGLPQDYFPTDVGHQWDYTIELLGETEPLNYRISTWMMTETTGQTVSTRGRYLVDKNEFGEDLKLTYRIKSTAAKQGPLEYSQGFELEIIKDDLYIFSGVDKVFWAVNANDGYEVMEVLELSPNSSIAPGGAWGTWTDPGFSVRIFMFADRPGTGIGLKDSGEKIYFLGPKEKNGIPCLHFTREVEANESDKTSDPDTSMLDKAFTEDVWFAKGKGMILLEQHVDDKLTMRWTLNQKEVSSTALPAPKPKPVPEKMAPGQQI